MNDYLVTIEYGLNEHGVHVKPTTSERVKAANRFAAVYLFRYDKLKNCILRVISIKTGKMIYHAKF